MNNLKVGFSRVDVTPMRGIGISGYTIPRNVEGILDNLNASAVALEAGGKKAIIISIDNLHISTPICDKYREMIAKATGISPEAVFMHCTHTHTGPYVDPTKGLAVNTADLVQEYQDFLGKRLADVSAEAFEDLKDAKMGIATGHAPNIAFVRRFRMKDGSVKTNPGVDHPDILAPIGDVDERVHVIRFDREDGSHVVVANFGCHPDTIGGNFISGDWPAFCYRTLEKALDNTHCVFFNGAQGDVNHVNVHPKAGDMNDMFIDFDDVARGYSHARHMGQVVAGAILQVWEKVAYSDVDTLNFAQTTVDVPSNKPTPDQLPEAHRIHALHTAGRDCDIPFEGMMLTTVVAEAGRMVRLENAPDAFPMRFSAVSIGNVVMVGVPGEPFTGIGRGIKEAEGWDMVLPCCLTNGSEGYFPMKDAYDEGGYEARSSNFKAGAAELIIVEGKKLADSLRK